MSSTSSLKAVVYLEECGEGITSPFFDTDGYLNFVSSITGEINTVNKDKEIISLCNSGGQPSAGTIYSGKLYVTDLVSGITAFTSSGEQQIIARVYEDKPFKGANSICFDSIGNMYFTDAGPFGETGVHKPTGSIFCITSAGGGDGKSQLLKPITSNCLAYPSGIAISPDDKIIYVTEQMNNRILRLVQRPAGVYHTSVFYQFQGGGMGPSCICMDMKKGNLYISKYDYSNLSTASEGSITVLDKYGCLKTQISVPSSEITGLAMGPDGKSLYITENSSKSIYTVDISGI